MEVNSDFVVVEGGAMFIYFKYLRPFNETESF